MVSVNAVVFLTEQHTMSRVDLAFKRHLELADIFLLQILEYNRV